MGHSAQAEKQGATQVYILKTPSEGLRRKYFRGYKKMYQKRTLIVSLANSGYKLNAAKHWKATIYKLAQALYKVYETRLQKKDQPSKK